MSLCTVRTLRRKDLLTASQLTFTVIMVLQSPTSANLKFFSYFLSLKVQLQNF